MKNVIVFGNQQIAVDCVKLLRASKDVNLLCVVGSESESDNLFGYTSISDYCKKEKLNFYRAEDFNGSILRKLNPNFCFSFYYRRIFKKEYINIPSEGFINIHPSLLPKYRGPVPTMWALLNGDSETGVTLHYIDEGIDSGDIISQKKVKINPRISGFELNNVLMEEGARLFEETLPLLLTNHIKRVKQDHKDATYYGPFKPSIKNINWHTSTKDIHNKIRTFKRPYLGARASINEKEIIIWSAEDIVYSKRNLSGPGKIVLVNDDKTFVVSTVDGHLLFKEYEFKDKNLSAEKYIFVNNFFV